MGGWVGGSTQVIDLQGYCTHSGCQEGRPRESARGSARERRGAWIVRGARAGGEARAHRVHDLPFMGRQSVPRTVLSPHARRASLLLHCCPSDVALELCALLSLTHRLPLISSVSVACLGDTWLFELSPAGDYILSLSCIKASEREGMVLVKVRQAFLDHQGRLDAGQRQAHLEQWQRRLRADKALAATTNLRGARQRKEGIGSSSGTPANIFTQELAIDPFEIGFAYGGVDPGTLHARGLLHEVHRCTVPVW